MPLGRSEGFGQGNALSAYNVMAEGSRYNLALSIASERDVRAAIETAARKRGRR